MRRHGGSEITFLSVQPTEKICKVAVARLCRRGLEGTPQRGRNPGVARRHVDANDPPVD